METDRGFIILELFAWYAGKDFGKWKKLEGCQVKHETMGSGIITKICRALNNQIDVGIQFSGKPYYWIRLDPSKNELSSKPIDQVSPERLKEKILLPDQLRKKILKEWNQFNQRWKRAEKNQEKRRRIKQEERTQAEQELKRKQELERERKIKLRKKEEQEKRNRRRALEPFIEAAKLVLNKQIKETVNIPKLNAQDIRLALEWYKDQKKAAILQQKFSDSGFNNNVLIEKDNYELERVLLARAAEKSVMEFYQNHKYDVEDVSIHGLTSESPDWRKYDLKINEHPFDVKNARSSKQNPNNYVEHLVPNFKEDRTNQKVTIAGVLSPNFRACEILNPENVVNGNTVQFLGVTNGEKLTEIKNEFETPGLLEINLKRLGKNGQFFPAWMFDYPKFLYAQRDNALSNIAEQTVPEYSLWKEFNLNPIPLCTAAGIDLGQLWSLEVLADWERSFLSAVLNRRRKYELSLPHLFLGILKHFLQMVEENGNSGYYPAGYKRLVYDPKLDPDYNMPLGIYDPLKTIVSLITSLDKLWGAEHGLIRSFRMFKLQGLNILKGRRGANDQWKTLIAYCGGWLSNENRKCRKDPLVLGDCEHCSKCGYLICPDCQFCREKHEDCLRKSKFGNFQYR